MEATINNTSKSAVISRINELKEHLGYSQARLAERCGLSKSNFCKMLGGSQTITDQTLHRLADEFGVSFRWLRNGIGEMFAEEKNNRQGAVRRLQSDARRKCKPCVAKYYQRR